MQQVKLNNKKGQSIVELIIAILLVSIVLTAVLGLVIKGVSGNTFNRHKTLTTSYSEELLEWLRSERDSDWATFYSRAATSTWCFPSTGWPGGGSGTHSGSCSATVNSDFILGTIYQRQVSFSRPNLSTINATVSVTWVDSTGTHKSESSTLFSNWKGNQ